MAGHREVAKAPKRTVGEFVFDTVVGAIISLAVLVTLKLVVPRIPRK